MPGVPNIIEVNLETSEDYLRMLKITRRLSKITKITGRFSKVTKDEKKQNKTTTTTTTDFHSLPKIDKDYPKTSKDF